MHPAAEAERVRPAQGGDSPAAGRMTDDAARRADEPGREILHPVAVTIFGGLLSATALDIVVTPVLFLLFGQKPLNRILTEHTTTSELAEAF